jgi:hypothetical protein
MRIEKGEFGNTRDLAVGINQLQIEQVSYRCLDVQVQI